MSSKDPDDYDYTFPHHSQFSRTEANEAGAEVEDPGAWAKPAPWPKYSAAEEMQKRLDDGQHTPTVYVKEQWHRKKPQKAIPAGPYRDSWLLASYNSKRTPTCAHYVQAAGTGATYVVGCPTCGKEYTGAQGRPLEYGRREAAFDTADKWICPNKNKEGTT
jgi:hypothetical protein